jgi:hypothetical protein
MFLHLTFKESPWFLLLVDWSPLPAVELRRITAHNYFH